MIRPVLTESNYRSMDLFWAHEPLSSTQLVKRCEECFDWKKSTTYTEIKRLSHKGYLKNQNAIGTTTTFREQVHAHASELFVEQTFGGSLPCFLAALLGRPVPPRPRRDSCRGFLRADTADDASVWRIPSRNQSGLP